MVQERSNVSGAEVISSIVNLTSFDNTLQLPAHSKYAANRRAIAHPGNRWWAREGECPISFHCSPDPFASCELQHRAISRDKAFQMKYNANKCRCVSSNMFTACVPKELKIRNRWTAYNCLSNTKWEAWLGHNHNFPSRDIKRFFWPEREVAKQTPTLHFQHIVFSSSYFALGDTNRI